MSEEKRHNCRSCKWLRRETESWELPHIWWWDCKKRPGFAALRSFPFKNTKCKDFEVSDASYIS